MLIMKGVFALPWTRGVGRNGKDTVRNILQKVLGSYAVSIAAETLVKVRDANAPSPVFAMRRARRFVAVREVDGAENIRLQLYKTFTDGNSELASRDLYEKLVRFKPHFLVFFAANNPPVLVSDYAVRQRTAVVERTTVFADQPDEANQQQWVPIEDMLAELTPGFFALFHLAYETLLWGRKMRTIGPVPAKRAALLEQELTDELGDAVKEFVLVRLEGYTADGRGPGGRHLQRPAEAPGDQDGGGQDLGGGEWQAPQVVLRGSSEAGWPGGETHQDGVGCLWQAPECLRAALPLSQGRWRQGPH